MLGLEKDRIIHCFNKDIETKRNEVVELERKKAYFLKNFQMYWKDVEGVLEKMEAEFPAVQPPTSDPEDGIDF